MVFSKDKAPAKLSGKKGIKLLSSPKTVERIGFGLFHNEIKLERLLNDQTRLYKTIIFIKHSLRSWWCFCTSEREGAAKRLDSPLRKTVSCEGLIKQWLSLRHPMFVWTNTMSNKKKVSELFTRGLAALNCPYFAKWETFIIWRGLNCGLNGLRNYQRVP